MWFLLWVLWFLLHLCGQLLSFSFKMSESPKKFAVIKEVGKEAKIWGLNYISFFIFLFVSIISFMLFFSQGLLGIVFGVLFLLALYFILSYIQTKLGPKQLHKIKNNFLEPIHLIKIKVSLRKLYKKENEL